MQLVFSDTTNKESGIIQGIEALTLGYGKISGNSSELAFFTQQVNLAKVKVAEWMRQHSGQAPTDDINNGATLPIEAYDTEDDQQDYGLDTDVKVVKRVECHDATKAATEGWYDLDFTHPADLPEDRFAGPSGTPSSYSVEGRSIVFDVPVDTDLVDQYRLTYDRNMHAFVVGDTTATSGFPDIIDPLLIWLPVRVWANMNNKDGNKNGLIAICNQEVGDNPYQPSGLYKTLIDYCTTQVEGFQPQLKRKYSRYE
jgi:hypothetical protein